MQLGIPWFQGLAASRAKPRYTDGCEHATLQNRPSFFDSFEFSLNSILAFIYSAACLSSAHEVVNILQLR